MNTLQILFLVLVIGAFVVVKESRRLSVGEVAVIISQVNAEFGNRLDPADVLAVVEIESRRDPRAIRLEPDINDASRGLMQVLYSTAVDRGYRGDPDGLFDPLTNVRIGMAHLIWGRDFLRSRLGREPEPGEWIGAYNAGVGNVLGGYIPQSYVAKWARERAPLSGGGFG